MKFQTEQIIFSRTPLHSNMWEWKPAKLLRCLSPCYAVHLLYFQCLTQQEEGEKTSSSYVCWTNYFAHLDLPSVFEAWGGKNAGRVSDATKKLHEIVHGFTSFTPARAVYCLRISSRSQVSLSPISWDVVWVEKKQEPVWHSWLPQCLLCKLRGPSAFLIYRQHSWILQQDQEYTIIKHPLGCLAHGQRRMSRCCIVSLRKFYPPEQRDKAGLHRRHRQKEGGRQSAMEERQV